MKRKKLLGWLMGTALVAVLFLLWWGPIVQADVYHHFALDNTAFGINHGANVLSNLGFLIVGATGMMRLMRNGVYRDRPSIMLFTLFVGIFLTGIGSAHYHLHPSNATLFWDRLPMTIVFTSLFSLVGYFYLDRSIFQGAFPVFILVGIGAVVYWQHGGEGALGMGDLRLYAFVQYFPMLAIPMIMLLSNAEKTRELWWAFSMYVLAKACELTDESIANIMEIGGHAFKHVFASVSTFFLLLWTQRAFMTTQVLITKNELA